MNSYIAKDTNKFLACSKENKIIVIGYFQFNVS